MNLTQLAFAHWSGCIAKPHLAAVRDTITHRASADDQCQNRLTQNNRIIDAMTEQKPFRYRVASLLYAINQR